MVASPASGAATAAFAQRLYRQRYGQQNTAATAPTANIMPRPNVTRPDIALHRYAKTPAIEHAIGLRTARTLTRISAVSPAETVPTIIIVVRTPSSDIRYGDTTLYETGCIPPYQARLYAVPGCRPTNSAQASWAAMSPPLFAKKKNQRMWTTAATAVVRRTGWRTQRRLKPSNRPAPSGTDSPPGPRTRPSPLFARVGSAVVTATLPVLPRTRWNRRPAGSVGVSAGKRVPGYTRCPWDASTQPLTSAGGFPAPCAHVNRVT